MTVAEIQEAATQAALFEHPERAMRVVLECAHMRLMPWHVANQSSIGASTLCRVCSGGPSRLIVEVQETGVLDESFYKDA